MQEQKGDDNWFQDIFQAHVNGRWQGISEKCVRCMNQLSVMGRNEGSLLWVVAIYDPVPGD